jgi:hypothetical protein
LTGIPGRTAHDHPLYKPLAFDKAGKTAGHCRQNTTSCQYCVIEIPLALSSASLCRNAGDSFTVAARMNDNSLFHNMFIQLLDSQD